MRNAILLRGPALRVGVAFPVLLAAIALLVFALNAYPRPAPFWADEAYTVLEVRAPSWRELVHINLQNEETPPLYFTLLRLWSMAWGSSDEATLRLFSAACLALTVPLVGFLGRRLWSPQIGLAAALLLAVNPAAHYYGQEARAYALALLLSTVLLLVGQLYLERPELRWAVGYVLTGTLLLYTNYFAAFTLAGLGLFGAVLLFARWYRQRQPTARRAILGWVAAQFCILALWAPWLSGLKYQLAVSDAARAPEQRNIWLQAGLSLLALGAHLPDLSILSNILLAVLFLALVVAVAQVIRKAPTVQWLWLLAVLGLPLVGGLLLLKGDGQFSVRYVLLALPAYVLLLAAGSLLPSRAQVLPRTLLVSVIALSACYSLIVAPTAQRRVGWDQVARVVEQGARPPDVMLFTPPWSRPAFDVQYQGPPLLQYGATSFAAYYYDEHHAFSQELDATVLGRELAQGHRVWLIWDRIYAHRPQLPPQVKAEEHRFGTTEVLLVIP